MTNTRRHFDTINPDEILRDRLIFGVRDSKVRERLLRESKLNLARTDEICRSAESMRAQMKMGDVAKTEANTVDQDQKPKGDQERIPNSWKPQKNRRKQGRPIRDKAEATASSENFPASVPSETAGPRRSQRQTKPPGWLKDFITPQGEQCFV